MTKEQEEAIEYLEESILIYKNTIPKISKVIETVLNMLKEKDQEIEKKDKIIDLMAEYIFQNVDVEEDICNSAYVECTQETAQDITCINCIKQYFESKVNSSEQN